MTARSRPASRSSKARPRRSSMRHASARSSGSSDTSRSKAMPTDDVDSLYQHGFARVASAIPVIRVGDVRGNTIRTIELARTADADHAALVVFPELGLVGYTG